MSLVQPRMPQVGETLGGKYLLRRLLGEGGMGTVFEAEHLRLRQPVALKLLNAEMRAVEEIVKRFEREARAAATLKSRHVVRVMDVEATAEGVPYMVMELLSGMDLETLRAQRPRLPFEEVSDYLLQACDALAEAHDQGIVHRDLKPANLFLARQEDDRVILKVLDFGISKFLAEETKLTSAGAVMGTAIYMSPEQIRGDAVDTRSDIWALGVILYELLTGEAPWTGPATRIAAGIVSEAAPDIRKRCQVPEELARLIERMLAKAAAERPATIAEVAAVLARFVPAGTGGAEAAERIMRREARSGVNSAARMVASLAPADVGSAKTMIAEKSTDVASTLTPSDAGRKRSARGIAVALAALAVVGAALGGVAFVRLGKGGAATAEPASAGTGGASAAAVAPPATSSAPAPSAEPAASGAAPHASAAAAAVGAGAPAALGAGVRPAASPRPSAKATSPSVATASAAPVAVAETAAVAPAPKPAPKPTTPPKVTNPLFLDEK